MRGRDACCYYPGICMSVFAGLRMCVAVCGLLAMASGCLALPRPESFASSPMLFVPNRGQAPDEVLFTARARDVQALFGNTRVWLGTGEGWFLRKFSGATKRAHVVPLGPLPGRVTWLRSTSTVPDVTPYSGLCYRGIYAGVDMTYRAAGGRLKSEFVVAPHADPGAIMQRYPGSELSVSNDGALIVRRGGMMLREEAPEAWQQHGAARIPVTASYRLIAKDTVAFRIGRYDHGHALVIDPILSYSTYYGGSEMDAATAVATDSNGNTYVAGWTESMDFPASAAPGIRGFGADAFVLKLDAGGKLVFLTIFGGSGQDKALGIAVDAAGNVYTAGSTASADFPTTAGAASPRGNTDAFVARLTSDGTQLTYSVILGGSGSDTAFGIAVDASGNAYVAGESASADFPVVPGSSSRFAGQVDAFAAKVTPAGSIVYSRFLGGSLVDRAKAIAVDAAGRVYITGTTNSADFPVAAAFQATLGGGYDAFVTKLDATGSLVLYSTYLGGAYGSVTLPEEGAGIAVDVSGRAFVCGTTASVNFPVINAAYPAFAGGSTDAFVSALAPSGQALIFGTFFGGTALDYGTSVSLDSAGNVYFAGYTASPDFPVTTSSFGPAGGHWDTFAGSLKSDGTANFSVRIGGTGDDSAMGIAAGGPGAAVLAGITSSPDFLLRNAVQTANSGGSGAFITSLAEPNPPRIDSFAPASGSGSVQTFSAQLTDPLGWQDIQTVEWLAKNASSAVCQIVYRRAVNAFQVLNDAGTAWSASLAPGSGTTIGNSQCLLSGSGTAASASGTTLMLQLRLSFLPAFAGQKTLTMRSSSAATTTAWQEVATWDAAGVTGLGFYPVTPCRLADTRNSQNKTGVFGPPSLAGYSQRDFPVIAAGCGIPASAQAFSLNMTVVPKGPLDFLSTWPAGQPYPRVSTLNSPGGTVLANAAVVPAGANGSISVVAGNPTDLIIDTNGYFAPSGPGELLFYPVTPCRIVDTRPDQNKTGAFGPPSFNPYTARDIPVRASACAIPPTAQAYALNLTAIPAGPLDFLSIWPAGQPFPGVSTLNSPDGSVIANAAIVPAGTNGAVTIVTGKPTHVAMDITGYFAPPGAAGGLRFYALTPCRVADTRPDQGKTGAFGPPALNAYAGRDIPVRSACGVPVGVQAFSLNVTASPSGALDFLSAWPAGQPYPGVSTLNSPSGKVIANAAIIPAGSNGGVTVVTGNATHVIMDINGYFAP